MFKNYDIKYLTIAFGLENNNNLCYLNSLIQSLTSCTVFNEYMIKNEPNYIKNKNKLALSFISIIKNNINNITNINNNNNKQYNVEILYELILLKKRNNKCFNYFGQQDVSECLAFILDSLNDEYLNTLFYHKYRCNIICISCSKIIDIPDDISYQFEVPSTINENNISRKLKLETVKLDYKCSNCGDELNIYKINRLVYTPPIIIINLNKYNNKYNFEYSDTIIIDNKNKKNQYRYKLISTIEHSSNNNGGGHYVSRCIKLNKKNKCITFLFNDNSIEHSNLLPTKNTYLLFYHLEKTEYYI